ncbi:MAG: hypothetical protein B0W54_03240 [Cellvibrio sp. 79]|nr:MAG: hypothetical protein B0W54_03240 [Cellvibrio sp. 79]
MQKKLITPKILSVLTLTSLLALPAFADYEQWEAERATLPKFEREKTVYRVESGKWNGPRLADGQPDVQGQWSNTISNHTNFTDPQGATPGETPRTPLGPRETRAPSRVVDPADGQIPYQPWARALQQEYLKNFNDPVKPEYVEPLARCAPGGPSKSFMWHGYEIRQFPGYLVFLFDSGSRIIHLYKKADKNKKGEQNNKPHLDQKIRLWNGDSRGYWEGNTLYVEVKNNNSKSRFGRTGEFSGTDTIVKERFIFDHKAGRYLYSATYTDPSVFTQPWTLEIPARRVENFAEDGWNNQLGIANHKGKELILEPYEQICTENNGGFGGGSIIGAGNSSPIL